MSKYSIDSEDDVSKESDSEDQLQRIEIPVNDWLKEGLDQIIRNSQTEAREAVRQTVECAVVDWNRKFERQNDTLAVPGEHIWEPDFRCIECKSANDFLFRELQSNNEKQEILCLNCDQQMSKEEVTRLARGGEIQSMDPYTLEKEGTKIRHKYEGDFRTPMRFRCKDCKEKDLILPEPDEVEALICPSCGNKGGILNQIQGPVAKGFEKYSPNKYHSEPSPESVGRGISRGQYDNLEKAYEDGHER